MKALINKIEDKGKNDYGSHAYVIHYGDKRAYFNSKYPNNHFKEGQECEFNEVEKESKDGKKYYTVTVATGGAKAGGYGKALQKERTKYSGFACSYAKDLCVAGKIEVDQMRTYTEAMFKLMVELDATLPQ